MDTLILENIRCFHARNELPLAPLTVLVGENSTGKSTLLAATRLAWDVGAGNLDLDFSEEPFDWGAYDQIAHYRGGRGGRAKTFTVGFDQSQPDTRHGRSRQTSQRLRFEGEFTQQGAQPRVSERRIYSGSDSIITKYDASNNKATTLIKVGKRRRTIEHEAAADRGSPLFQPRFLVQGDFSFVLERLERFGDTIPPFTFAPHFASGPRPYAIAPIRTKPQRTYEPRRELQRPEGEHVPMILAKTKSADPEHWDKLREELRKFGVESGLFKNVGIKRLGAKESAPFQLQISIVGPPANLVDVGYGISQVLPILVDCLESSPGQMLLMQQPEVHLHPRAQAALSTFMGYLLKSRKNTFVVETHSDYFIDRLRLDIRDGKYLRPDDVMLLYCERDGVEVKVHPIRVDSEGNLVGTPPGYRRFFLDEEKRFIGGK